MAARQQVPQIVRRFDKAVHECTAKEHLDSMGFHAYWATQQDHLATFHLDQHREHQKHLERKLMTITEGMYSDPRS